MDNETMLEKIKELGYYHVKIIPTETKKIQFNELDSILNESSYRVGGRLFPTTGRFSSEGDYYICNNHRISHFISNQKLESWNFSTSGEFELYETYIEDMIKEYKEQKILDIDYFFDMITLIFIISGKFAKNLESDVNLQISMYNNKNSFFFIIFHMISSKIGSVIN